MPARPSASAPAPRDPVPPDVAPPEPVPTGLGAERAIAGLGASDGVVVGPAFVYLPPREDPPVRSIAPADRPAERRRFNDAVVRLTSMLEDAASREAGEGAGAQVFAALRELAVDPSLIEPVEAAIAAGQDAASATIRTGRALADGLAGIDDAYFRLRAEDVRGIARQIGAILLGAGASDLAALAAPSILVAGELTAVEIARLPTRLLIGLLLTEGGVSSHVAIIARSLGIPAVVAPRAAEAALAAASVVALDGDAGVAVLNPSPAVAADYARRSEAAAAEREALRRYAHLEPKRADGTLIEVAANISSPDEIEPALASGAMGVGLFRTEFLFMRAAALPTEEEQYRIYARVLAAFAPRPVVVRTLDIGGDKALPGLAARPEANPFLGWRGIRMCLGRPELFRPQLRALLRAAAHGRLRVMFPMISDRSEVAAARAALDACAAELRREAVPVGPVEVGIMIETPAAALCASALAHEADFFSIGTNDLTQYTMAADRTNPLLASLGRVEHPAVQRLIEMTCEAARNAGIRVGICGEAASDPALIERFLDWGVTELSMSASLIPRAKRTIALARR